MKILSIKLRNINSLKGDWEVDFTKAPLKDAGLFAIVGPTGSGKSTLLDCITLALFNKVPRLGNISKDSIATGGWIMTRHEKECYTEVKYSCKSGFYTSKWSIAKTKKGESFQDYAMQVYDENGVPLTDKRGDVPAKNAALIGLNYEQFIKAILLSQGEFAKFLQSDAKDKAKLLEEITGQKDYRRLGKRAFEYQRSLAADVDQQKAIAANIKSNLLTEAAYQFLVEELNQLEGELQQMNEVKSTIAKQIATKKQIETFLKNIESKKGKIETIQKEIEQFNIQYALRLKNYEDLLPYKDNINEFIRLSQEDSAQSTKISELENAIAIKGLQMYQSLKAIEDLLKSPVSTEDYLDKLENFKTVVLRKLQQQKQFLLNANVYLNKTKTLLNKGLFVEENKSFNQLGNNLPLLKHLKTRSSNTQNQITAFCEKNNLLPENIGERLIYLRQQQNDFTRLEELVKDYVRITQNVQRLSNDESTALLKIDALQLQMKDLELQEMDLTRKFDEAEMERAHFWSIKNLDQYRKELVSGEACPLCGSEVHPYVTSYLKDFSVIDNAYQNLKIELEQVKLENVKSGKELEATRNDLDRCKKELVESDQEKQQKIIDINFYKEKYNIQEIKSINAVQELKQECGSLLVGTEACNEWILEVPQLEQLSEEIEQFDENATNLHALNQEIDQLYSGNDVDLETRQLREGMTSISNALREDTVLLENTKSTNQVVQMQLQNIASKVMDPLLELGFDSIFSAKNALIDEASYKKWGDQRNVLASQLQTENKLLEQQLEQLEKELQLDESTKSMVELVDESEQIEKNIRDSNEQLAGKRNIKFNHEARSAELVQKELHIKALNDKKYPFDLLKELIGDSAGDKFNKYAQKLSLRHLLTFTNLRLQKINNRYFLKLNENQGDADIEVEDSYMAYERRSVKTLSGGETFMVSLALALGLSDLASRDIRIESLFIDEGFGTLDGDTLEDAISTLEQLQSESNKLVGIISHVDSLKERITTQLILERQNNGYSTLKITQ